MKKRIVPILLALLAAQAALAIGINRLGSPSSPSADAAKLVAVRRDDIDRVVIDDSKGGKVVLIKSKDVWELPDQGGFPADGAKVDGLLGALAAIEQGPPIATSHDALKRFKLTEDAFERRIVLAKGEDTLATIYLGTSQGAHEIHARRDDQDAVYAVALGAYRAPTDTDEWIDDAVLRTPVDEVGELDVSGLKMTAAAPPNKTGAAKDETAKGEADATAAKADWRLVDAKPGAILDPSAAANLAGAVARLRIASVLGRSAKPEYGLDKPVVDLSLLRAGEGKDRKTIEYKIGKMRDGDDYVLKVSSRPEYFRIPGYAGARLIKASDRKTLLKGGENIAQKDASSAPKAPR